QRNQVNAPAFVKVRILLFKPNPESIHVGARLRDSYARLKYADGTHESSASHARIRTKRDWKPKLRRLLHESIFLNKEIKAWRHHAYDCLRHTIKCESLANHIRIATEVLLPKSVAEHSHVVFTSNSIFLSERATQQRPVAEQGKERRSRSHTGDLFGITETGQVITPGVESRHVFKHMILFAPVEEVRSRNDIPLPRAHPVVLPNHYQAWAIGIRQRL